LSRARRCAREVRQMGVPIRASARRSRSPRRRRREWRPQAPLAAAGPDGGPRRSAHRGRVRGVLERRSSYEAIMISTMLRVKLDRNESTDLHAQVAAEIRRAIAEGEAKPGER